ncbi:MULTISPECIES: hypothetical protein [unclassified Microbacterium]|uniref:hypothetical protein n=1 Tax=unclassified Microbacterium TaxID=2609290 RepID=UPI00301052BD
MGSIAAYQSAAGRRYRVRWRDDTTHRQVEKRGFKTKPWRVYVLPRWSDTRIGDIRASQVEQWIRELSEGTALTSRTKSSGVAGNPRSATVVYRALGVLAGILDTAVRDGRTPATSRAARRTCRRNDPRSRDGI